MRKAILLYNPLSGQRQARRIADVEAALAVLLEAGVEASAEPTRSSAAARDQAQEAILAGCDTVFACGGDGTVHDILQGMVNSPAALAIIPLGTANCLAHDIRLPLKPAEAARAALRSEPRRVTLGRIQYLDFAANPASRYFIVTAGVGMDALLFYRLGAGVKQALGMLSYHAKATHLWLSHRMERFLVDYVETGKSESKRAAVTQLLAVRIQNFGGVLQELAPGASLLREDLRLVLFRTTSRWAYLLYIIRGFVRERFRVPGIELVNGLKVACQPVPLAAPPNGHPRTRIYVEVDGELVGVLPAEITAGPDAVTLLMPPQRGAL